MRRLVVPVLATALIIGVIVVGVFPTRSYLSQRAAIASASKRVDELTTTNDTLQAEADRLQTDAEIEAQARTYGYVKPGEEAYHILPAPEDAPKVPDVWPFSEMRSRLER
ncbi:MAG: FtsB family cell division protein [Acidimicrobiales bacterium]